MSTPTLTTLPLNGAVIDPAQLMGLDAAFFAMDIISTAYSRLLATLPAQTGTRAETVAILDDAWSMADNANRLHVLLRSVRGLKQGAAPVKVALKALHEAESLRNVIQHLNGELTKTAASGRAVWGELYWSHIDPNGQLTHHLIWTGTQYTVPADIDVPAPPAGLVTSSAPEFIWLLRHPDKLHLSDLARAVDQVRVELEAEVMRTLGAIAVGTPIPTLLRLTFPPSVPMHS